MIGISSVPRLEPVAFGLCPMFSLIFRKVSRQMWFRVFLASWSIFFLALLAWLATHKSSDATILGHYSSTYFILLGGITILTLMSLLAHFRPVYSYLQRERDKIILLFFSIFISLIAAEVATRTLDPLGISHFEEASKYHLDKVPDSALVYKHAPGLTRIYQGVEVSINELGLRDRAPTKKQEGELRLLLLGDSVTFGWGVPVEQTFSRRLEAILSLQFEQPVRTVNSGVGGYNTVQEYTFLKKYAHTIEPDIVSLLYVSNDISPNYPPFNPWSKRSLRGKSPPEVINLLLKKSWLYRLVAFTFRYSRQSDAASVANKSFGWKQSMESLRAMASFCKERQIRFVTFFSQGPGEMSMSKLNETLLADLSTIGRKMDFHVCDVKSWWKDSERSTVTNSIVDSHPNERGHEILAAGMANYIIENVLIPE